MSYGTQSQQHYADYLNRYRWTHFTTQTFSQERTAQRALHIVSQYFRYSGNQAFTAVERGLLYGRVHAHTLVIERPGAVPVDVVQQRYNDRFGFMQVRRYRAKKAPAVISSQVPGKPIRAICNIYEPGRAEPRILTLWDKAAPGFLSAGGAIDYVCKYVLKDLDYYDFINWTEPGQC